MDLCDFHYYVRIMGIYLMQVSLNLAVNLKVESWLGCDSCGIYILYTRSTWHNGNDMKGTTKRVNSGIDLMHRL